MADYYYPQYPAASGPKTYGQTPQTAPHASSGQSVPPPRAHPHGPQHTGQHGQPHGHPLGQPSYTQPPPPPDQSGFGLTQWVGAACSLALLAGLVTWGANLVMRDVSEVPVIRALGTPMRVQPDDPGGQQMAHQGLAVNQIRAGGPAAPAPERIVLAPPPVSLDAVAPAPSAIESASRSARPAERPPEKEVDIFSLADQLGADAEPLGPVTPRRATDAQTPPQAAQPYQIIPTTIPGVSQSLRPLPRPADGARLASARPAGGLPTTAQTARTSVQEVAPADVPAGTRLVQLGAFDDPASARAEWDRLYAEFGDYMQGKSRMIMEARSGGRDFYRLRVVGFDGANDARRFCSAFLARNTACIPVVAR